MSEKTKEAIALEDRSRPQMASASAGEVFAIWNQAKELLKDVPWVGIGAALTALGAAILYCYFRSIDYIPTDIPAILGASAAVAALAVAFLLTMVVALIAPRWQFLRAGVFTSEASNETVGRLRRVDWLMVAFQLLGPGAFLLYVAIDVRNACKVGWIYPAVPGLLFFSLGLVVWLREEFARDAVGNCQRAKKMVSALWVIFWSLFPFIALFWFLIPMESVGWLDLVLLLVAWLAMVLLNATLNRGLPVWGLVLVVSMLLPALLFSVPALAGRPAAFPIKVALLAGIRSARAVELRVPKEVCALVQSSLVPGQSSAGLQCDATKDWGLVKAQVLSNLGDRWLIDLETNNGGDLRITVPSEGVQTVRRLEPKVEISGTCRSHPF